MNWFIFLLASLFFQTKPNSTNFSRNETRRVSSIIFNIKQSRIIVINGMSSSYFEQISSPFPNPDDCYSRSRVYIHCSTSCTTNLETHSLTQIYNASVCAVAVAVTVTTFWAKLCCTTDTRIFIAYSARQWHCTLYKTILTFARLNRHFVSTLFFPSLHYSHLFFWSLFVACVCMCARVSQRSSIFFSLLLFIHFIFGFHLVHAHDILNYFGLFLQFRTSFFKHNLNT